MSEYREQKKYTYLYLKIGEKLQDYKLKGPRPKWTVYKHISDKFKKCLSVGNSGILLVVWSVVCRHLLKG